MLHLYNSEITVIQLPKDELLGHLRQLKVLSWERMVWRHSQMLLAGLIRVIRFAIHAMFRSLGPGYIIQRNRPLVQAMLHVSCEVATSWQPLMNRCDQILAVASLVGLRGLCV